MATEAEGEGREAAAAGEGGVKLWVGFLCNRNVTIDIALGEAFGTATSRMFFIILHIRDPRVRPPPKSSAENRESVKMHMAKPIGRPSSSLCAFMCLPSLILSFPRSGDVSERSVYDSPTKLFPTAWRKPVLVGGRCWWCCPARLLVGKIPRFESTFFFSAFLKHRKAACQMWILACRRL